MADFSKDLQTIKAILKAGLTKAELSVLAHLMSKNVTTVTDNNSDMAKAIKMAQPNFVRSLQSLKAKNVVGERSNGIFIKSKSQWSK